MKFQYRRGGGFPRNHLCRVFFICAAPGIHGRFLRRRRGDSSPAGAPGAPTGVTAVAGAGQARVSWDNVAGATSYNLYYSQTPGVDQIDGNRNPQCYQPQGCHSAEQRHDVLFRGDGGQRHRRERGIQPGFRGAGSQPSAPGSHGCHGRGEFRSGHDQLG